MESASTPVIGETKYDFETEISSRHKVPRLMIEKTGADGRPAWRLKLMLPVCVREEDATRYKKIAAAIYLSCIEKGIPGRLYGKFEYKYDAIVLTHKGRPFCRSMDVAAFEQDNPIAARPDDVPLIAQPTLQQVMNLNQGREVRPA